MIDLNEYKQFVQDKLRLERELTGAEIGDALGRLENVVSEVSRLQKLAEARGELIRFFGSTSVILNFPNNEFGDECRREERKLRTRISELEKEGI